MKQKVKSVFFFLIYFLSSISLFSENDLKFRHITVLDGLLHNSTTSIVQDSIGFIWIGTQRGLNRYDGHKVDSYLYETSLYSDVYSNRIRRILIDQNCIWILTYKGLECFDIRTKQYVKYFEDREMKLNNNSLIQTFFIDSQHRMWIGSRGKLECVLIEKNSKGIFLKSLKFQKQFHHAFANNVPEITELNNGMIILKKGNILSKIVIQNLTIQKIEPLVLHSTISDIKLIGVSGNDLWLFGSSQAVAFRNEEGQFVQNDDVQYPISHVVGIAFSNSSIWLSTTQGLLSIDRNAKANRVRLYSHSVVDDFSISSDHQSGVYIDNQNNLWISTWSGGVSYANINKQKFNLVRYMPIKNNKYLPNEFVYSIHEDNQGDIYVGTKFGGISKFNLQKQEFDYTIDLTEKFQINSVVPCIDSDDDWIYAIITTSGSSIYRFHKRSFKMELVKSFSPYTAFSFGIDKHSQMWVGLLNCGLSCLKIHQGKVVNEKIYTSQSDSLFKLSSNSVNYVYIDDQKNEILIATENGLNRLMLDDKGTVNAMAWYLANESNPHTLSSNYLWPIDKENDSIYWIGSLGSGLNRIVIGERTQGNVSYKAERFGIKEGAPSNDIESVLVDNYGNVWCGGRYLSRFNYQSKKFKTYYEEDGLQSYLFGTGTSCKTRDGMLFFGGMRGLNYFIPDTITEKSHYKAVFSRIAINGKPVNLRDTVNGRVVLEQDLQYASVVKLPYPCNNLKIEFTSLTYSQDKTIQYRYKLLNVDKDWNYTDGTSSYAIYTTLPYGRCKFIIEVSSDDNWSSQSRKTIEFDVLPPWRRSGWAILIYIILASVIILIAVRYSVNWINMKRRILLQEERENQKEELMALKLNFFTNISHEFKNPLTLINAAISEFENQNKLFYENRYFQIIKRNNTKLLCLISELMDFLRSNASLMELKTTQIDVGKFVEEIFEEFIPLSETSQIDMRLRIHEGQIIAWIDEECLTKILSNVILNSLRYTEAGGFVDIQLSTGNISNYNAKFREKVILSNMADSESQLIISVLDSGIGISADSLPKVFERFHTVISKTSKHLGSGVGLALVKSLIELHKGGLIISSERNVGTEFVFFIPLDSTYLTENQKIKNSDFDSKLYLNEYKKQIFEEEFVHIDIKEGKSTILIVDDNQEILMILREHFKGEFNVLMAMDGEEALEQCNKKFPDIIISDVMMPRMNGLELCNRIKSQLTTCFIPFILLTSLGTVEQQIDGMDEGADAYIPKPFNMLLLRSTIINLLNKSRLTSVAVNANATDSAENLGLRNICIDKENQVFIEKLATLIEQNLEDKDFTIDKLCLEMGVSRSRLYAQVKSVTNKTLGDFIREIRLQKASELLRSTSLTISEVAYKVGIDSPSFFTRSFKDRFALTPSEYVKKAKGIKV